MMSQWWSANRGSSQEGVHSFTDNSELTARGNNSWFYYCFKIPYRQCIPLLPAKCKKRGAEQGLGDTWNPEGHVACSWGHTEHLRSSSSGDGWCVGVLGPP